jgi:hypothetical protein
VKKIEGAPHEQSPALSFQCPECGKQYPTEQQLRGHLSGHARQKKKPLEEEPARVFRLFDGAKP